MFSGIQKEFFWVQWLNTSLFELVSAFPQIVHNQFIIVTSFDSGPLELVEEEILAGWQRIGEYAYSPQITDVNLLPSDQYDEWYVFSERTTLSVCEVFVNYSGFSLQPPAEELKDSTSAADRETYAAMIQQQERFWKQLHSIAPQSYFSDGDNLILVTRDEPIFKQVIEWKRV